MIRSCESSASVFCCGALSFALRWYKRSLSTLQCVRRQKESRMSAVCVCRFVHQVGWMNSRSSSSGCLKHSECMHNSFVCVFATVARHLLHCFFLAGSSTVFAVVETSQVFEWSDSVRISVAPHAQMYLCKLHVCMCRTANGGIPALESASQQSFQRQVFSIRPAFVCAVHVQHVQWQNHPLATTTNFKENREKRISNSKLKKKNRKKSPSDWKRHGLMWDGKLHLRIIVLVVQKRKKEDYFKRKFLIG